MKEALVTFSFLLIIAFVGHSFSQEGVFFFPPEKATLGLNENEYNELIHYFQKTYTAQVLKTTGKPVIFQKAWQNPYFNGSIESKEHFFQIHLWGGTARTQGASPVVMAGILCHELGHILGGEPHEIIENRTWSSVEGQADFFATKECLPTFLKNHSRFALNPSRYFIEKCQNNNSCAQTLQAAWDLTLFFQTYDSQKSPTPDIHRPAPPAKELLRNAYPSLQCRWDTFVAGALCQVHSNCQAPECWSPRTRE
ncbi:MAG: hypothetical protein AAGB31_14540 [Bdellovibrio sp.]